MAERKAEKHSKTETDLQKKKEEKKKTGRSVSSFFLDVKAQYYLERGSCLCSARPDSGDIVRGRGIK